MGRTSARWTCFSLAVTLVMAAGAYAQNKDQERKNNGRPEPKSPTPVAREGERASGVIVKAESIRMGPKARPDDVAGQKDQAVTHRLTINTAAVWRDWVRDQAGISPAASAREQARRGVNSVATRGEPQSADTLVVIDVAPSTKVETRFRASTDETSKGEKTPAAARAANGDPASTKKKGDSESRDARSAKITRFQADDLQPGLFVEIDFRQIDARNLATTATVIRPVGGPDDAPATTESKPKK
jgi:hypothetical protein